MPTTSQLAVVVDRLIEIVRAGTDVTVFDGPPPRSMTDKTFVVIGVDDLTSDSSEAATANQEWANLGKLQRDERGQVWGVAVAWSGGGDFGPLRHAAFDVIAQIERVLRADPQMALGNPLTWADMSVTRVLQFQSKDGPGVHVQFQVSYRARI